MKFLRYIYVFSFESNPTFGNKTFLSTHGCDNNNFAPKYSRLDFRQSATRPYWGHCCTTHSLLYRIGRIAELAFYFRQISHTMRIYTIGPHLPSLGKPKLTPSTLMGNLLGLRSESKYPYEFNISFQHLLETFHRSLRFQALFFRQYLFSVSKYG